MQTEFGIQNRFESCAHFIGIFSKLFYENLCCRAGLDYVHGSGNVLEGRLFGVDGVEDTDSHVSVTIHEDGRSAQ